MQTSKLQFFCTLSRTANSILTLIIPGGVESTQQIFEAKLLKKISNKPNQKHPCKIMIFYAIWGYEKKISKNLLYRHFSGGGVKSTPPGFEKIYKK